METAKQIISFVNTKQNELLQVYKALSSDADYLTFIAAAVHEYAEQGTEEFYSTFVEFGETFTTRYNVVSVLSGMAAHKAPQSVVNYAAAKSQVCYNDLLLAHYYKILSLVKSLKEEQTERSTFSTEIALLLILAAVYFTEDVPWVADYFAFYVKAEEALMKQKIYADSLGKTDLLPLSVFIVKESVAYDLPAIVQQYKGQVQPAYRAAMTDLYSENESVVSAWVNELVTYHMVHSKDDWTAPFNHTIWQYFPVEIIALLVLRERKGLSNHFIDNPLLNEWKPFINSPMPIVLDDLTKRLMERIKK